jgi:hypothetical protein
MRDFINICGLDNLQIEKYELKSNPNSVNIKKCKEIIKVLLIHYKNQFDICNINDDKYGCVFYNRAKSALKNFSNILSCNHHITRKLFNEINHCISYIVSKDPHIETFFEQVVCSNYLEKCYHLKLLKNKDHFWKKIASQILVYKKYNNSYLNHHLLDDNDHISKGYLFFFCSMLTISISGLTLSSLFFYSNIKLNALSMLVNSILFLFSLYSLFFKSEFLSMRKEMSLFNNCLNNRENNHENLNREQISI